MLSLSSRRRASPRCPIPKPPAIDARAYVLIDYQSGRVLAADKADVQMEPASITKLMTGYVVFRALQEKRLSLTDSVTISEHAWKAEGSRTFAQVGTQIPVDVLIKGMIVQSGNDATIALAEKLGGTEDGFVQMMNTYAPELGLKNSHFDNSWGGPGPTHYMSAHDIASLSRVLIRDYPGRVQAVQRCASSSTERHQAAEPQRAAGARSVGRRHQDRPHRNRGLLPRELGQARRHAAHRRGARHRQSFKAREDASAALLNYGFTFFETVKAKGASDVVLKPEVYKGEEDRVTLVPARDVWVTDRARLGRAAQDHGHGQGTGDRAHQGRPGAGRAHRERRQGSDRARAAGGAGQRCPKAAGGRAWWTASPSGWSRIDRWASRCRSVS